MEPGEFADRHPATAGLLRFFDFDCFVRAALDKD